MPIIVSGGVTLGERGLVDNVHIGTGPSRTQDLEVHWSYYWLLQVSHAYKKLSLFLLRAFLFNQG